MPKTIATDVKGLMETFKNAYKIEGWKNKPNLIDFEPNMAKVSIQLSINDGVVIIQALNGNDFCVICYLNGHSDKWDYSHKFSDIPYAEAKKTLLHICDIIFDAAYEGESYKAIVREFKKQY